MSEERNEKNAIFGSGGPSAAAAAANIKSSMGLDIPTEIVPLPSQGKIYKVDTALHGKETLEIRPMTTREEDILTNRALIKKGTVVTALIKACLVNPDIDVKDLIAGDRNALMIAIRVTGYGADYTGELECSECNAKFQHEFDLAQLPIKPLDIDPVSIGTNEFAFTLPLTKKKVTFKYLTGRDEEDIIARQEAMKKKAINGADNVVTTRLLYSVVTIEGCPDRSQVVNFINNMPARDSLALRKYMDDHEPGVEMKQIASCTACGASEEVEVPMGVKFFWPNAER